MYSSLASSIPNQAGKASGTSRVTFCFFRLSVNCLISIIPLILLPDPHAHHVLIVIMRLSQLPQCSASLFYLHKMLIFCFWIEHLPVWQTQIYIASIFSENHWILSIPFLYFLKVCYILYHELLPLMHINVPDTHPGISTLNCVFCTYLNKFPGRFDASRY